MRVANPSPQGVSRAAPRPPSPSAYRPSEHLVEENDPGLFREIADRESGARFPFFERPGEGMRVQAPLS
jgi:hypothetical protein